MRQPQDEVQPKYMYPPYTFGDLWLGVCISIITFQELPEHSQMCCFSVHHSKTNNHVGSRVIMKGNDHCCEHLNFDEPLCLSRQHLLSVWFLCDLSSNFLFYFSRLPKKCMICAFVKDRKMQVIILLYQSSKITSKNKKKTKTTKD